LDWIVDLNQDEKIKYSLKEINVYIGLSRLVHFIFFLMLNLELKCF